ncbi:hypothetical protein GEV33_009177 [Tenebrio molitor]|uniref:Uncharacterized protein n=1 Tax=Tenebrio molitor TaxID=7067 RepID=A0A8J6HF60_TENMO|nr:hypothetical protein GEV33_009177 [Tenebrio molitor]
MRLGPIRWAVVAADYDFLECVLSNTQILNKSDDYLSMRPWLGTGLLTSEGCTARPQHPQKETVNASVRALLMSLPVSGNRDNLRTVCPVTYDLCFWLPPPAIPSPTRCARLTASPVLRNYTMVAQTRYHPVTKTSDYNVLEYILSSSKLLTKSDDYRYAKPWLGTGLLTSEGQGKYTSGIKRACVRTEHRGCVDIKFGRFGVQIPGQTVELEYLFTRYAFNLVNNYQDKLFIKELGRPRPDLPNLQTVAGWWKEERHSPDTTARLAGFKSQAGWPPMDVVCCDIRVVSSRKRRGERVGVGSRGKYPGAPPHHKGKRNQADRKSVQQVLANPWRRTEAAGKPSKRNSNRTSRRIKASFTRVIDQRIIFATLLGRRHPQGSHQRTGPHTGLSLAEEPESRSNSYLARKGRGEEGPRGLSEDTDGVIDQRRKKDSEDLPPAHSSRDSLRISSPRLGPLIRGDNNFTDALSGDNSSLDVMTMK